MKKFPLLALLLLGGCYATAEPIYLPDGSSGYRISCGDYVGTPADCIQKAGEMCGPNGYQTYDQAGRLENPETQNSAVIATLNNTPNRSSQPQAMFVKCKTNDMPVRLIPMPMPPQVEVSPDPFPLKPPMLSSPPLVQSAVPPPATGNGPIPLQ